MAPSIDDFPEVGTSRFTGLMHAQRDNGADPVVEGGYGEHRNPFRV
jgi:hypothetical protein